ncbi:hypothetical protein HDU84_006826 [Entophlyctis sp. JEL0112]|nr:hypothetical protein HDU84_006826 [Entophlyctis sp. JEL0112]
MIKPVVVSVLSIATGALVWPYATAGTLYSLHPIAMGIFVASSIGAVVTLQRTTEESKTATARAKNVDLHAALQVYSFLSFPHLLDSMQFMRYNKVNNNRGHFKTPHSIFGATVYTLSVATAIAGILLKNNVIPRKNMYMHRYFGLASLFGAVLTVSSGLLLYYEKKVMGPVVGPLIALAFAGCALVSLYNPLRLGGAQSGTKKE